MHGYAFSKHHLEALAGRRDLARGGCRSTLDGDVGATLATAFAFAEAHCAVFVHLMVRAHSPPDLAPTLLLLVSSRFPFASSVQLWSSPPRDMSMGGTGG